MSKEDSRQQILKKWIDLINPHEDGTQAIYAAMAEFANEQAIAFAQWLLDTNGGMKHIKAYKVPINELYELFLQSQNPTP